MPPEYEKYGALIAKKLEVRKSILHNQKCLKIPWAETLHSGTNGLHLWHFNKMVDQFSLHTYLADIYV